jgi:hypothetical protein
LEFDPVIKIMNASSNKWLKSWLVLLTFWLVILTLLLLLSLFGASASRDSMWTNWAGDYLVINCPQGAEHIVTHLKDVSRHAYRCQLWRGYDCCGRPDKSSPGFTVVAPFTRQHAERAAQLSAALKRQSIGFADFQIAAAALVDGAELLAFNQAHFSRVPGLKLAAH